MTRAGVRLIDTAFAYNDSLKRLNIDYIDLLLLHHPGENDVRAYKAMEKAVKQGTVRSIRLSNWYIEELQEFLPQASITPALVQNEIHPSLASGNFYGSSFERFSSIRRIAYRKPYTSICIKKPAQNCKDCQFTNDTYVLS